MPGTKASSWIGVGVALVGASLALVMPLAAHSLVGRSDAPGPAHRVTGPVVARMYGGACTFIDLGTVAAASRSETPLLLVNDSRSAVEIGGIQTSCPCVSVELARNRIAADGNARAIIHLDLSDDPEFVGGLGPEVEFRDVAGKRLAFCIISANVARANAPGYVRHVNTNGPPERQFGAEGEL